MEPASGRDKKTLLREWKAKQRATARQNFPLADPLLSRFFDRLDELLAGAHCGHGYLLSRAVVEELGLSETEAEALWEWCEENGGYCDCEISANTRQHWESVRDAI